MKMLGKGGTKKKYTTIHYVNYPQIYNKEASEEIDLIKLSLFERKPLKGNGIQEQNRELFSNKKGINTHILIRKYIYTTLILSYMWEESKLL